MDAYRACLCSISLFALLVLKSESPMSSDAGSVEEDSCVFHGSESAMVNPQSTRSSTSFRGPINKKTANPFVCHIVFPERPKVDLKINLDNAWEKLKPAIRSIFLDEPKCFTSIDIFNAVHFAWKDTKLGETLYNMILEECGTYISANLQSLEGQCNDDPSVFLPLMEKCWLDYGCKMQCLCSLAGSEGHQRVGGSTLWDLGLELFPTRLCLASQLRDKILSNILLLIRDQRSGKSVDVSLLKNIMDMFYGECFYKTRFFEKPFVECATEFYAAEAMHVLEQSDLPQYLKYAKRRLCEEKEKCYTLYFFTEFEEELIKVVERELLGARASAILEKGFEEIMDERFSDDLHTMYDLFSEANLLGHINNALSSFILKTGRKILAEGSSLQEFKDSVDQICTSYFCEDVVLEKTVEQCFKDLGLPWKDRFSVNFLYETYESHVV